MQFRRRMHRHAEVHADVPNGRQAVFEQRGILRILRPRGSVREPRVPRADIAGAAVGGRPRWSFGLLLVLVLEECASRADAGGQRLVGLPLHSELVVDQLLVLLLPR